VPTGPVHAQPIQIPRPLAEITVILDASGNPSSRLRGGIVSHTEGVLKVLLTAAVGAGVVVGVAGEVQTSEGKQPLLGKFRIRSCRLAGIGKYHAELVPEVEADSAAPAPSSDFEDADYYEILQVSRTADTDTIRRVFHVLAQRYHPDNKETGNEQKFRQVVEAHATLGDVDKRAAHDVKLAQEDKTRYKIFDSLQSTQGVQAEIRKRKGILRLLYARRMADPHAPSMKVRDFTEMLGCPQEHLEFALWFLRESKFVNRADNNRFEITRIGVEAFEAEENGYSKKQILTLPAAGNVPGPE